MASHTTADINQSDEKELAEFGYKQELLRDWDLIHNFGISFSVISVITGITTLFSYGLNVGGPAVMSVGWIVVAFFTFLIALSMAEIVSAFPTSGGPYFWAALLAPRHYSAFASWVTGWFGLLGQVAGTTGISFALANLISTVATVRTAYVATPGRILGIYATILVSHGFINTFGVHTLRYFNITSIVLQSLGVMAIVIATLAKAPTHQSASFVFSTFYDGTAATPNDIGWSIQASPAYVACCGALLSQYTMVGYDASTHLSEETRRASRTTPIGVITSLGCSAIFGFFVLISLLFSIQDFESTVTPPVGQPVLQIFIDIFGDEGGIILFSVIIICVWHCGLFDMTSTSRMMFAISRDGVIPSFFRKVDSKSSSPTRTIWLSAFLSFCFALPSLGSSVAFQAATSIATIGLYISYGIPILITLINHREFKKGPFNMGLASRPVAFVGLCWIIFITIAFCLPVSHPISSQNLNYTAVAVGVVAIGALVSWAFWAQKWFNGPNYINCV